MKTFSLDTDDPEVIQYLEKFPKAARENEARRALQIGVSVINRVSINTEMHYIDQQVSKTLQLIEKKFLQLSDETKRHLHTALDPFSEGSYLNTASNRIKVNTDAAATTLEAIIRNTQDMLLQQLHALEEEYSKIDLKLNPANAAGYLGILHAKILSFENDLQKQFNETDSASFVGKLHKSIDQYFGSSGETKKIFDQHFKLDLEGKSPLGQLFVGLKAEISALRDSVVATIAKQECLEGTTRKGFVFEELVMTKLEGLAKPFGDVVEDISLKVEAISNSKKGDFLYIYHDSGVRLVIDAKNYGKLKSLPAMLAYIKEAIKERNAQFGIIVAPDVSSLQKQVGSWNVYNNCIVCSVDFLDVAIKYAKYYCQLTTTNSNQLSAGNIKLRFDEIGRKLKDFTTTKSKLTKLANGVGTAVHEIQELLDDTRETISRLLEEIDLELKKAHH